MDGINLGIFGASGFKIFQSVHCVERKQFRFPRAKKRRIRKKWANRECNFKYIPRAYKMDNNLYVHPSIYQQILRTEYDQKITTTY